MRTITIRVPRDGFSTGKRTITVDADGFSGTSCRDATRRFIEALGESVAETEKPEMYEGEVQEQVRLDGLYN